MKHSQMKLCDKGEAWCYTMLMFKADIILWILEPNVSYKRIQLALDRID